MAVKYGTCSLEEKREAVAYFDKNKVTKHIEHLLNQMFKEKPNDIFGYMAEYFGSRSQTPTISKVSTVIVLGSRGYSTFGVDFHCIINGLSKFVATAVAPVDSSPTSLNDPSRAKPKTPDLKSKTPEQAKQQKAIEITVASSAASVNNVPRGLDIDEIRQRIEDTVAPLLVGSNPVDQIAVDAILQRFGNLYLPLFGARELEENERAILNGDSTGVEGQTEDDGAQDKLEILEEDSTAELIKKSTVFREIKQPHATQDTAKKPDIKRQSVAPKETLSQGTTDLEEDEVVRDWAMISVSMASAMTGAKIKGSSLYKHLALLCRAEPAESFTLPIPMMTLLTSGKFASGKQNLIKKIMILPVPGTTVKQALQQLTAIHSQMGSLLSQKYGASGSCVTDDGSYSPALDKPEQALDYVQDAVNTCGYSLGTDVHITLNCAASEFFDQEKQKYEVITNTFKSLDDVINLYCELHERYPGIVAIVDGVRSPDKEGWIKLNQRIGEKCYIVGGDLYRKHSNILDNGVTDKLSSGVMLSLDQANTITGLLRKANAVSDQGGILLMEDGPCPDSSSVLVDAAVACGSRFIKLGGPVRGEHVTKYRRLQEIEQELEHGGLLALQEQHVFPVINTPEQKEEGAGNE